MRRAADGPDGAAAAAGTAAGEDELATCIGHFLRWVES
jgi:hypothetical protein